MFFSTPESPSSSHQDLDERSLHALSEPVPIPSADIYKPLPPILSSPDSTPGIIHHGRATIADYTMWHFPEKIKSDEEKITSYRAPPCWVSRLSMPPRPRCELQTVQRKEVEIVPQVISPLENKREINRLMWAMESMKAQKLVETNVDEGYESCGDLEGEMDESQGDFSVWSC